MTTSISLIVFPFGGVGKFFSSILLESISISSFVLVSKKWWWELTFVSK